MLLSSLRDSRLYLLFTSAYVPDNHGRLAIGCCVCAEHGCQAWRCIRAVIVFAVEARPRRRVRELPRCWVRGGAGGRLLGRLDVVKLSRTSLRHGSAGTPGWLDQNVGVGDQGGRGRAGGVKAGGVGTRGTRPHRSRVLGSRTHSMGFTDQGFPGVGSQDQELDSSVRQDQALLKLGKGNYLSAPSSRHTERSRPIEASGRRLGWWERAPRRCASRAPLAPGAL